MLSKEYFENVRGAVYVPTAAWNAFQQWRDYNPTIAERDLGYAKLININAIRIWLSYEYWLQNRSVFEVALENFLETAWRYGMRVMPSLFECCGREPNIENIDDTNQFTATAIRSPGSEITNDCKLWNGPFGFVDWFMEKHGDDERILAVEVTNEPKSIEDHLFAVSLLQRAKEAGKKIPVTIGAQTLFDNIIYRDYVDIYQTHENIHLSEFSFKGVLERAKMVETVEMKPVWVTEWQQIRKSGIGFSGEHVDKSELWPNHKSMGEWLHKYGTGNFVWGLMLKPAYLTGQRSVGTFNGIFHEDGSVYSLADARCISGNPDLILSENRTMPQCFDEVMEKAGV